MENIVWHLAALVVGKSTVIAVTGYSPNVMLRALDLASGG